MASGPVRQRGLRLPRWFNKPVVANVHTRKIASLLDEYRLHTVCQSARCPNKGECFSRGTATFMILGDVCTRGCLFCAVTKGIAQPVDPDEPGRVAQGARALGLRYVVVTSVTRDDLPDGGAEHFAETIGELRLLSPVPRVEVLTPDFRGRTSALAVVMKAGPDVFNHNVETVPRLYHRLRPQADYRRSLNVIEKAKALNPIVVTKSGIMVGLGERRREVLAVMRDLRQAGCEVLTIGQYLSPSSHHYPVSEFISPETFSLYRRMALDEGFVHVSSSPLTRSSYQAGELFNTYFQRRTQMRITITARHFETDQALEDHVRERLMTLKRYFEKVIDAHVILSVEKYRQIAEITLKVSGLTLASKEQSENMRTSVDRAVSKLERQVKRYKGKLTNHKIKKPEPESVAVEEPEEFVDSAEEEEGAWSG